MCKYVFFPSWTKHVEVLEPMICLAMAYSSYLTAEMLHLSGILAYVYPMWSKFISRLVPPILEAIFMCSNIEGSSSAELRCASTSREIFPKNQRFEGLR